MHEHVHNAGMFYSIRQYLAYILKIISQGFGLDLPVFVQYYVVKFQLQILIVFTS